MPIGVTKLKRRYHRLQIICMLLLAFSIGSAIGGFNRKLKERRSYQRGFNAAIDTAIVIVNKSQLSRCQQDNIQDSILAISVEYFVNHSEIN